jgi:hypothetical protein
VGGGVAKYDWNELKQEYILGTYNDLKEFSDKKNINYGYLRQRADKWNDEKLTINEHKTNKIIEKTIQKDIEKKSNDIVNIKGMYEKVFKKINKIIDYELNLSINMFGKEFETDQINNSKLKSVVEMLEKGQKGYRLESNILTAFEIKKLEIEQKKLDLQREILEINKYKSGINEDDEDTYKMIEIPSIDYDKYDKEQQQLIDKYKNSKKDKEGKKDENK